MSKSESKRKGNDEMVVDVLDPGGLDLGLASLACLISYIRVSVLVCVETM